MAPLAWRMAQHLACSSCPHTIPKQTAYHLLTTARAVAARSGGSGRKVGGGANIQVATNSANRACIMLHMHAHHRRGSNKVPRTSSRPKKKLKCQAFTPPSFQVSIYNTRQSAAAEGGGCERPVQVGIGVGLRPCRVQVGPLCTSRT